MKAQRLELLATMNPQLAGRQASPADRLPPADLALKGRHGSALPMYIRSD